jgi:uncharacterized protein YggE
MWSAQQSIKHPLGVTVYGSALLRTDPDSAQASVAVAAGRRKAEVYCEAAACRLGEVLHIEDVDPDKANQPSSHMRGPGAPADQDGGDAGGLGSGSLTIAAAVMIVYALLPEA